MMVMMAGTSDAMQRGRLAPAGFLFVVRDGDLFECWRTVVRKERRRGGKEREENGRRRGWYKTEVMTDELDGE